jgi:putative protease
MGQPRHDNRKAAKRRRPEILAPAGDAASLQAALQSGADAVYFGLQEGFNARARAGNFSLDSLADTVQLVHRSGARAYLTLNTLVFEPELAAVARVVRHAAQAGIDALLVQDPAVAMLARAVAPELELHASTQMTVSSPEAAEFARRLGMKRVVLPRELSVQEIGDFVRGTDLETEVFVHGALCVSWSGQCLTSEAWGGRSANRGQCAQSCRMPYDLVVDGEVRDLGDVRYLLSPKDLAGVRAVPELVRLGVRGLKIEGRQKGPQYVATAVAGYRRWVDAVADGRAESPRAQEELQRDLLQMSLSFSRGFGDGFLAGSDHQTLVEGRFPKHRGVCLGKVVRVGDGEVLVEPDLDARPWTGALALDGDAAGDARGGPQGSVSAPLPALGGATHAASGAALAPLEVKPGMGVVFDAGHPEDKNEPGGPIFRVTKQGKRFLLGFGKPGPDLRRVTRGQRVWVTSAPDLARSTERLLKLALPSARQPLALAVEGAVGSPLHVVGRTQGHEIEVETPSRAVPAAGSGLTRALLEEKLGALGGTPFVLEGLDVSRLPPGLHVPVSELKSLRREIVSKLSAAGSTLRSTEDVESFQAESVVLELRGRLRGSTPASEADAGGDLVALCRSEAQLEGAIEAGLPEVELDWMEFVGLARAVTCAREAGMRVTLATLRVQKPGEESFDGRLAKLEPDGVLVRHWGGLVHFAKRKAAGARVRVHGDFSLNVTNSLTAWHLFENGLDTLTASHDLDESQLVALLENVPASRVTVVVHHRIATFHTEHCVYSHLLSQGRDYRTCGRPCEAHQIALRDHLQQEHPVIVDAGCRNTVFNSQVQSSARLVPRLLERGVRRFRVEFVRESREEATAVLTAYRDLLVGRITPDALLRNLGVHSQQGVAPAGMALLL